MSAPSGSIPVGLSHFFSATGRRGATSPTRNSTCPSTNQANQARESGKRDNKESWPMKKNEQFRKQAGKSRKEDQSIKPRESGKRESERIDNAGRSRKAGQPGKHGHNQGIERIKESGPTRKAGQPGKADYRRCAFPRLQAAFSDNLRLGSWD